MLLLSDLIKKTIINTGQQTISIDTFGYDNETLTDIFETTLGEYEKYRPLRKRNVYPLDSNGFPLPDALRVLNVRLNNAGFTEFIVPLDFKFWELSDDKKLKCAYAGNFYVEYLAKYTFDYIQVNDTNIKYITSYEDTLSFINKSSFKKGTLNISITDLNSSNVFSIQDDLSSYSTYQSNFTINTSTEILTILESVGKKLKTGSKIKLSTTGTLPTGFNSTDTYFVIKESDITIKLANSYINAFNNIVLNFTDIGTGTHTITTQISTPEIALVGTLGSGIYNLETNKVTIELSDSFEGTINISYISSEKGIKELSTDEALFMKLFKANFMVSLGLNRSILKLENLPWDFSVDDLVNRGEKMKIDLEEKELPSKSKFWLFR